MLFTVPYALTFLLCANSRVFFSFCLIIVIKKVLIMLSLVNLVSYIVQKDVQ